MTTRLINIAVGDVYNRLTALEFLGLYPNGSQKWLFQCTCGEKCISSASHVVRGKTKSCGCLRREATTIRTTNMHAKRKKEMEELRKDKERLDSIQSQPSMYAHFLMQYANQINTNNLREAMDNIWKKC